MNCQKGYFNEDRIFDKIHNAIETEVNNVQCFHSVAIVHVSTCFFPICPDEGFLSGWLKNWHRFYLQQFSKGPYILLLSVSWFRQMVFTCVVHNFSRKLLWNVSWKKIAKH